MIPLSLVSLLYQFPLFPAIGFCFPWTMGFGGVIAITGFRTGFLEQLSLILSIAVLLDIGEPVAKSIEDPINQWIGLTGLANRILGCLLVAVAVTLVITLVSRYMARKFLKEGNRERWNHWLGFISGGLIGLMILAYGVGIFSALAQHQRDNTPQSLFGASGNGSPNSRAGRWIKNNGELIEQSTIGSAFVWPQTLMTVKEWRVVKDCRTIAAFLTSPPQLSPEEIPRLSGDRSGQVHSNMADGDKRG